jgi:hypothetical protein
MDRTFLQAMTAGTAARQASASTRRNQIAQLRTALQMHKAQNQHHRQQVSAALVRLQRTCAEFRRKLRGQINARVAARQAR